MAVNTFQTNIYEHSMESITDYALFQSGLNNTRDVLLQYDPMKTGFHRLFMVRRPIFVNNKIESKLKKFKHILEYANTGVSGFTNLTMSFNKLGGGYTGREMDIPNIMTDDMQSFTVKTYEFSGSLVREVIQYWLSGVADIQSGYGTYHDTGDPSDENGGIEKIQANQTAEFLYLVTDQSGRKVEYAAFLANCMPKEVKLDQFNSESGTHNIVEMDIEFTCSRYHSPQINSQANKLLTRYNVLMNSLNFNSGYDSDVTDPEDYGTYYNLNTGKLEAKTEDQNGVFITT